MNLRLPRQLAESYIRELLYVQFSIRRMLETDAEHQYDRWMFARFADAIDVGLRRFEPCSPEAYDGPFTEAVRERERSGCSRQPTPLPGFAHALDDAGLARKIANEHAARHPDVLWPRWLAIAEFAPDCQNDACEAQFVPIVLADRRAVRWFIAASVHTWVHSGVWTPPYLHTSLARLVASAPDLDATLQAMHEDADPHARWMAAYAVEVLDGYWDARGWDHARLAARYNALLAHGG